MSDIGTAALKLSTYMPKVIFLNREQSFHIECQTAEEFSAYVLIQDLGIINQGLEPINIDTDLNTAVLAVAAYVDEIGYNLDADVAKLLTDVSSLLTVKKMPWELCLSGPTDTTGAITIEFSSYHQGMVFDEETMDDLSKPVMLFEFAVLPKAKLI